MEPFHLTQGEGAFVQMSQDFPVSLRSRQDR